MKTDREVKTQRRTQKERYYQRMIEKLHQSQRDNDYIVSKGDAATMSTLKFWRQIEYYSLLEQIIKESERAEAQRKEKGKK